MTQLLSPRDRLIVALDLDAGESLDLARTLQGRVRWVKVGMTLFYEAGPQVVTGSERHGLRRVPRSETARHPASGSRCGSQRRGARGPDAHRPCGRW